MKETCDLAAWRNLFIKQKGRDSRWNQERERKQRGWCGWIPGNTRRGQVVISNPLVTRPSSAPGFRWLRMRESWVRIPFSCSHFFWLWLWPSIPLAQWRRKHYILKMFGPTAKYVQYYTWHLAFWFIAPSPVNLISMNWQQKLDQVWFFNLKTKGHFSYLKWRWSH